MKNNNQIGWLLAVAGVGVVGFYLFSKNKPVVATEQLSSIDSELGTIKSKSEEKPKTLEELGKDAVSAIQNMTDAEKEDLLKMDYSDIKSSLINDSTGLNITLNNNYTVANERIDARIENEFPLPVPLSPTDAYVCIKLDVLLRDIVLKIQQEQKKIIGKSGDQAYVNGLQRRKAKIELIYNSNSCPMKIENLRLEESALLLTKGAIVQENLSASKANTDQQIYIGVGALIALTGLYMVLKK